MYATSLVGYFSRNQRSALAHVVFIDSGSAFTFAFYLKVVTIAIVVEDCVYASHHRGTLSDTVTRPSVCPMGAAALGCRHSGCLQLTHVQTADLSVDGCRSAASRTAIVGEHIVSPPPGQ